MNKEVLNKFMLPALAFVVMGIVSTFLFGKLDKMSDMQIDILQRVTAVEVQINGLEEAVDGLVETQGTVQGNSGDNSFEIRMINRDISDLKIRVNRLEDE